MFIFLDYIIAYSSNIRICWWFLESTLFLLISLFILINWFLIWLEQCIYFSYIIINISNSFSYPQGCHLENIKAGEILYKVKFMTFSKFTYTHKFCKIFCAEYQIKFNVKLLYKLAFIKTVMHSTPCMKTHVNKYTFFLT